MTISYKITNVLHSAELNFELSGLDDQQATSILGASIWPISELKTILQSSHFHFSQMVFKVEVDLEIAIFSHQIA